MPWPTAAGAASRKVALPPTSASSSWATPCSAWSWPGTPTRTYPDIPEGMLAKVRSAVVNARVLAQVADRLDVGDELLLGRGEESSGGRAKASILADAFEAILGAVYLDAGWDAAEQLVLRELARSDRRRPASSRTTSITRAGCRRWAVRNGEGTPRYVVVGSGPDHDRSYVAEVFVAGTEPWRGSRSLQEGRRAGRRSAMPGRVCRMPELPEVETLRQDLSTARCAGKKIKTVAVANGRSVRRHASAKHFRAPLEGRSIKSVGRLGKYLLMTLDSGDTLVVHLGMSGQLMRVKSVKDPKPQAHPRGDHLHPGGRVALRRSPDLRRAVRLHATAQDRRHADQPGLGHGRRGRSGHPQGHPRAGPPRVRPDRGHDELGPLRSAAATSTRPG